VVGIVSLVVLAVAIIARYVRHLSGAWRWIYAANVVVGLYLNFFVLVAQAFQKVPVLKAIAPTQSEAPFVIAQLVDMALFVVLGIFAVKGFHPKPVSREVAFGQRLPKAALSGHV
jgi:fatty acid desaturase